MDRRSPSSALLAWLLVPVAAYLVQSALSLPRRAYTGLAVQGDLVAAVEAGSPGDRAGIAPGDRLLASQTGSGTVTNNPIVSAVAGRPLTLLRQRADTTRAIWLVPEPPPAGERRLNALLLVLGSAFVLMAGWVWSERRDALTRAFFLVCISLGILLAPPLRGVGAAGEMLGDLMVTALWIMIPALLVHFFATFPEARAHGRRRAWIRAAYVVALVVTAFQVVAYVAQFGALALARPLGNASQIVAVVWLVLGGLCGLLLFAASFFGAGSADARRRLRVAFLGSLLGLVPLIALTAFRNLSPGTALPGERGAVALALFVPASFAWAIVVHRVFDFRVALRAVAIALVVTVAGVMAWVLGEWGLSAWAPQHAAGVAGGTLACVALAASLAGPAAPLLRVIGARLVPGDDAPALTSWLDERTSREAPASKAASDAPAGEALLAESSAAIARFLRLDGCVALAGGPPEARVIHPASGPTLREPGPELRARTLRLTPNGLRGIDEAGLGHQDREAMRMAGVSWLLPIGEAPVRAVLLLGNRLAGPWLSRGEIVELERFARGLGIALENADLKREATSHGALAREMREAGRMQAHLLPQRVPVSPTLDCAAAVLSSEPVGGDYYDFVEGPDRSFTLAVGDVAGHGLPAALLLSHVQARFRSHAGEDLTPGELLGTLNQEIADFDQPQKFVGLVCARVDVRRGRIWIANAGLTPPIVRRMDGRIEEVEASGTLLGVQRGTRYADRCLDLGRGDMLVVHTDGLTEAQRGDELFGMDRTRELVRREGDRRAVDVLDTLVREVRAFADHPLDDLTLVVLRQLAAPPARA